MLRNLSGCISRPIVHNEQFPVLICLIQHRQNRFCDVLLSVISGHDHADQRLHHALLQQPSDKMRNEPLSAKHLRTPAGGLRHLRAQIIVIHEKSGVVSEFIESFPQKAADPVFYDLWLSTFVYDHRYAPGGHGFHCGYAKMFDEYRSGVLILSVSGCVPENTCPLVKALQLVPSNIGPEVCAGASSESRQSIKEGLVLRCCGQASDAEIFPSKRTLTV